MKNFSTWLLILFMGMFWVFRIIVALMSEISTDFPFTPLNGQMEIILLFVVLLCMILIVKRKIVGALIYLLAYGMYFGVDLLNNVNLIIKAEETIALNTYTNTFISLIGMVIPIAVLFDLLLDKNRKNNPRDKKTDWFYKNENFDRKLDERADKNNYRTM